MKDKKQQPTVSEGKIKSAYIDWAKKKKVLTAALTSTEAWIACANYLQSLNVKGEEWISVEDKLPGFDIPVLTFLNGRQCYVNFYYKWSEDVHEWDRFNDDTTHWMPLPPTPEEKGGEG